MPAPTAAPARIFGAINPLRHAGAVVPGIVDAGQQATNGALLQAAFDAACSQGKYIEIDPVRVEYNCQTLDGSDKVGLWLRQSGHTRGIIGGGARGGGVMPCTMLVQYATDHPALTLGAGSGSSDYISWARFEDFALGMGANGAAGSAGLMIGKVWLSHFERIGIRRTDGRAMNGGADAVTNPMFGIDHRSGSSHFSNVYDTVNVASGQTSAWDMDVTGTGNVFDNIYIGGGGSKENGLVLSAAALKIANSVGNTFNQLNIEWITTANHFQITNNPNVLVNGLHLEGNSFRAGADPALIQVYGRNTKAVISGVRFYQNSYLLSEYGSGVASLVRSGGGGQVTIRSASMEFRAGAVDGGKDAVMRLAHFSDSGGSLSDEGWIVFEDGFSFNAQTPGAGGIDLDQSLPLATYGQITELGGRYEMIYGRSRTARGTISPGDANVTAYGAHRDLTIKYAAPLTAARKVILSDKIAAASPGNGLPRHVGDSVRVIRTSGATGAFDLAIRDAADATTIATLSAASTVAKLFWTGSAWVTG